MIMYDIYLIKYCYLYHTYIKISKKKNIGKVLNILLF